MPKDGLFKVFALNSASAYGRRVAEHLQVGLADHEERYHADKECYLRALENVRRTRAFVIQNLHTDQEETVDQKLIKLLWFIGALRDASADDITVVAPYFPYARSDRKVKSREGVITKYLAECLEAVGCDRILTMDVHNLGAMQNAFRVRVDNLECKNLLADYMAQELEGVAPERISVLTPDAGGLGRAGRFRTRLNRLMNGEVKIAFFDKLRVGTSVRGSHIVGEVAPHVVIVDDMISSGSTIAKCIQPALQKGAERIYAIATHGLFVGEANENLSNENLYKVVVSDTISPFRLNGEVRKKLHIIDTTRLFGEAIRRTYTGESLSGLFE